MGVGFRGPRLPGPTTSGVKEKRQIPSELLINDPRALLGQAMKPIAIIYFGTDESTLSSSDTDVIDLAGQVLKDTYLLSRGILEVYLEARADARHTAEYNLDLSEKRGEAVRLAIASRLPGLPGCRLMNLPFGKGGALPSPRGSDYDRRVEILALWRPYTGEENKAWAKVRSDIFRHYYPHYHKWKGMGLEYLIEQWEVFMGMNYPIRLNPADFDKVRKLVRDYNPELTDDKLQTEEQLSTAFYVIYNKAYREAHEAYEMAFLSYRRSHRSTPYEEAVSIVASGKQR